MRPCDAGTARTRGSRPRRLHDHRARDHRVERAGRQHGQAEAWSTRSTTPATGRTSTCSTRPTESSSGPRRCRRRGASTSRRSPRVTTASWWWPTSATTTADHASVHALPDRAARSRRPHRSTPRRSRDLRRRAARRRGGAVRRRDRPGLRDQQAVRRREGVPHAAATSSRGRTAVLKPVAPATAAGHRRDVPPAGDVAVIRTYFGAVAYRFPSWKKITDISTCRRSTQGESITAPRRGDEVWVGSEGANSKVLAVPLPDLDAGGARAAGDDRTAERTDESSSSSAPTTSSWSRPPRSSSSAPGLALLVLILLGACLYRRHQPDDD